MKFLQTFVAASAAIQATSAVAVPEPNRVEVDARQNTLIPHARNIRDTTQNDLWKRKGGGGGGPKGGGGSTPKGSGSTGSGSGTGSSAGGSPPKGAPNSNSGGLTAGGSGVRPAYGAGGTYYGGGATRPYKAGTNSPLGITPFFLGAGAVGFLGAAYVYGAYSYPYRHQYYYHNATTNKNETKPVECICSANEVCGCDDNGDDTYFRSVIGDGSYQNLNQSLVRVYDNATNNDTSTILLLGTLPNGTTADGGTENPNAADGMSALIEAIGWWPVVGTAAAIVFSA